MLAEAETAAELDPSHAQHKRQKSQAACQALAEALRITFGTATTRTALALADFYKARSL